MIYGHIVNQIIINIISPLIFVLILIIFDILYEKHIKKLHSIHGCLNEETHYKLFIKHLKKHEIGKNEIQLLNDLFVLENETKIKYNTGFLFILTLIYVPVLLLYFSNEIMKMEIQIIFYLSIGLFIVPLVRLFYKYIFKRNKNKYMIIAHYLKRRIIELNYKQ
jgi:hypothetical protein